MLRELITNFIIFWAVWILIPVMLDGTIAVRHIVFSWQMLFKRNKSSGNHAVFDFYPNVSVVVPVYNSEKTLYNCLRSLADQTYPASRMEIFLIDNGSSDNSFGVFNKFHSEFPNLPARWVRIHETGKAKALNSGIFLGNSDILVNIDSDSVLDREVITQTAYALMTDQNIAGATGAIMIDYRQVSHTSVFRNLLQNCELFEYLEAFYIGRKYQASHNTLFTLAGAFSCFNRKFLLQTHLYDANSIAEDAKLTFELRRRATDKKITFLENAQIYVEPIPSLSKLYSQRVRWQRGELDVISSYLEHYQGSIIKLFKSFAARLLFCDHTMIFPRIVWTVLTPLLVFLGYPPELIIFANLFVYLIYLFIDINCIIVSYFYVDKNYRQYLITNGWKIIFLPIFRFLVFWFRAAAAIHSVTETAQWNVKNPITETREAVLKSKDYLLQRLRKKTDLSD